MESQQHQLARMLEELLNDVKAGKYGNDSIDTTAFGEALQTALGEVTPPNKEWTVFCDFVDEDEDAEGEEEEDDEEEEDEDEEDEGDDEEADDEEAE